MKYEIIDIEFKPLSFRWANGRYMIIDTIDTDLHICKIENGQPRKYNDGKYDISITGVNNKGISRTKLVYDTDTKKNN